MALLCDKLELIKRLLRDALEEVLHAVMRLFNVAEELLGMRPSLSASSSSHILFDFLPIFPKELKSF